MTRLADHEVEDVVVARRRGNVRERRPARSALRSRFTKASELDSSAELRAIRPRRLKALAKESTDLVQHSADGSERAAAM